MKTVGSRLTLLMILLAVFLVVAALFRRLGLGEVASILAILVMAFGVEIVRYIAKQFVKGYESRSTGSLRAGRSGSED